eukprot:CAMPEP_0116943246 /NCGR_PEP_ID=MMETSP0467-20121206/35082_1 /TAXON_ID=283647 /ORGANISM="Mesodinium pulex, Strain SPMC105" /LENGTH=96 /DNA_ID=CAMNT_0004626409 /DNA_START=592 /DNA_END=881 /DNA_ORIENTATION=-
MPTAHTSAFSVSLGPAFKHLGAVIGTRAHTPVCTALVQSTDEALVAEFDVELGVYQNVLRLEVEVRVPCGLEVPQSRHDLLEHLLGGGFAEPPCLV